MLSFFITTNCHAQTTDQQDIQVEATIGPWNTNTNGNDAGNKVKPTVTIPPSDSSSSAKLPQTGAYMRMYMLLLGWVLSLFSLTMLINVNREKKYVI